MTPKPPDPVIAPRILGRQMRHARHVVYQLYFSHVFVEFEGPLQQPGQVVPMFTWRVGSSGATYAKSREEAIAAIERELLAIKAAIPEVPERKDGAK